MSTAIFPIQVVVDRTGLSAHVIRMWEKRYAAVTPSRTGTNRRLYSEAEIARLRLLRELIEQGHAIGHVARLPTERLQALAQTATSRPVASAPTPVAVPAEALLQQALEAVARMDAERLGALLKEAEVVLGSQGVLQRLVGPLADSIGRQWRSGAFTAAHEHFATAALRLFVGHAARPFAAAGNAPVLVAATPSGQLHELGALLAGATAANLGWRVVYLGASLPAAEIAGAARQSEARAVALSFVYPEDDPGLGAELGRLRELMPATPIVAGGRAAPAYRAALDEIGAELVRDLDEFGELLDRLRRSR